MCAYRTRRLDLLLPTLLAEHPAVMLTGPRAAGKTTTATRHAAHVVRLDQPTRAAAFHADPDAALSGLPEPVLLDEWQEVPELIGAVKRAVDVERRPGRFLLTGSVTSEADPRTWPGVGRIIRIPMHPLSVAERFGRVPRPLLERLTEGCPLLPPPEAPDLGELVRIAVAGGFPEPALSLGAEASRRWYASYADQIALHGRPARRRLDSARLLQFLRAWGIGSAGVASETTLHRAAGVDRRTGVAYREWLTRLGAVWVAPAWATNRLKRLVRQPKRFVADTGLWAALLGLDAGGVLADGDRLGQILETFVANQLRAECDLLTVRPAVHHLREAGGRREVDLILELPDGGVIGLEVKATGSPRRRDARHLAWLRDTLGDQFVAGAVLHAGQANFSLGERLQAAPISTLWA